MKRKIGIKWAGMAVAACLAMGMTAANAVVLAPGGSETVPNGPQFGSANSGTYLDDIVETFSGTGFSGTLRQVVVENSPRVVGLPGVVRPSSLDFYYQLTITSTSSLVIESTLSFSGFTTDVFETASLGSLFAAPTGTVEASSASRDASGSTVSATYIGAPVNTTYSTYWFAIRTDADDYARVGTTTIGIGGMPVTISTFAPIPEPGSALAALAIGGVIASQTLRRNRGRTGQPVVA